MEDDVNRREFKDYKMNLCIQIKKCRLLSYKKSNAHVIFSFLGLLYLLECHSFAQRSQ